MTASLETTECIDLSGVFTTKVLVDINFELEFEVPRERKGIKTKGGRSNRDVTPF